MYKVVVLVELEFEDGETQSNIPDLTLTGTLPFVPVSGMWLEAMGPNGEYAWAEIRHVGWRIEGDTGYFDVSASAEKNSGISVETHEASFSHQGWEVVRSETPLYKL